jgi:hypothetical protein
MPIVIHFQAKGMIPSMTDSSTLDFVKAAVKLLNQRFRSRHSFCRFGGDACSQPACDHRLSALLEKLSAIRESCGKWVHEDLLSKRPSVGKPSFHESRLWALRLIG